MSSFYLLFLFWNFPIHFQSVHSCLQKYLYNNHYSLFQLVPGSVLRWWHMIYGNAFPSFSQCVIRALFQFLGESFLTSPARMPGLSVPCFITTLLILYLLWDPAVEWQRKGGQSNGICWLVEKSSHPPV